MVPTVAAKDTSTPVGNSHFPDGPNANGDADNPPPVVEEEWDGEKDPEQLDKDLTRIGAATKKKRKNRKKGKTKPTGFEEYMVEGPMTQAEVQADLDLYHPSKPFSERIETCIQRYKSRRKWDPLRLQIFSTYMALGGISSGSKQFSGGIDQTQMDGMDAGTLQQLVATEFVRPPGAEGFSEETEDWAVDFDYIVRGFLSYKVPYVLGYQKITELELACKVVRNFLNYVVCHDVCPEHVHSVLAASKTCETAETELVLCRNVSNRLPGKFNMACSTLFGGYYEGMRDDSKYTWNSNIATDVGLEPQVAHDIYTAGLAKRGTQAQKEAGVNAKVVKREFISMEVTGIILPTFDGDTVFEDAPSKDAPVPPEAKYCRGLESLGRLKVKTWIPAEDEDAPGVHAAKIPDEPEREFEILLERQTLQFCFLGMHLDAKVHTLDSGLLFIDSVTGVMCSFYLKLDTPDMKDGDGLDDDFD